MNKLKSNFFEIYGLHESGKNQTHVSAQLGTYQGQVNYSLRRITVSTKKRKITSSRLKEDDINQIISYVESSPEICCKTFSEPASASFGHLGASERVLQRELKKR